MQLTNRTKSLLAAFSILLLFSSYIGYVYGVSSSISNTTIEAGSMVSGYSYIIFKEGLVYYAKNGITGVIDYTNTDIIGLISSVGGVMFSGKLYFKSGTYVITNDVGFGIIFTNKTNFTIEGETGAIWKQTKNTDWIPLQILRLYNCHYFTVRNIIFDQDRDNIHNQWAGVMGSQWLVTMGGDSSDILFENCQFINGVGCGIVTSRVYRLTVKDCVFNNFGEHPLYLGDGATHPCLYSTFENLYIYNYGKIVRGYGPKIACGAYLVFKNIYVEPNEDGLGYDNATSPLEWGARGPLITNSHDISFDHITVIGSNITGTYGGETGAIYVDANATRIYFNDVTIKWFSSVVFTDSGKDHYYELTNSKLFGVQQLDHTGMRLPSLVSHCYFFDSGGFYVASNDTIIEESRFFNLTLPNNPEIFTVGDVISNLIIRNNLFQGFNFQIMLLDNTIDALIEENFFDNGVTSTTIKPAVRTAIIGNTWIQGPKSGAYAISTSAGTNCMMLDNRFGGLVVDIESGDFDYIRNNIGGPTEKP